MKEKQGIDVENDQGNQETPPKVRSLLNYKKALRAGDLVVIRHQILPIDSIYSRNDRSYCTISTQEFFGRGQTQRVPRTTCVCLQV